MFQFVSDTVAGGWNAVSNIAASVSRGASQTFSSFFPTAQKQTPIRTQITQPVISNPNINYRPTAADAPSLAETAKFAYENWLGSPYEDQYGAVKSTLDVAGEAQGLFAPWKSAAADLWNAATGAFSKINDQLPNVIMERWGLVPVADQQNTQGEVVYQVWGSPDMTPATHTNGQPAQPAGLFSLGFPQWGSAPVVRIPGTQQTISTGTLGIAAIALIGLFVLAKK